MTISRVLKHKTAVLTVGLLHELGVLKRTIKHDPWKFENI